jgi:hypothetical protein
LEKIREENKVSLEFILNNLGITRATYGKYLDKEIRSPKLHRQYCRLLKVNDLNLGANEMRHIEKLLTLKREKKAPFYRSLGMLHSSVLGQINNNTQVSFEQVARAYGRLGYKIAFIDTAGLRVREVETLEYVMAKKFEEEKDAKG